MKFEFNINDLQNFLEKKGYYWNKKALIDNEYKLVSKNYLNSRNFVNGYLNIKILQGTKKLNLELDISSTKFVIVSCDDPWLGKLNYMPRDFSKSWCKHLILTYGVDYIKYFKNYNDNLLKRISQYYETEKQRIDEQLNQLTAKTKHSLEIFNRNQELINNFCHKEKER